MENLYLLSGDDNFAKMDYLDKLKQNFSKLDKGINYLKFDKDNISNLSSELTTYSFFSEPKLIVVSVPKNKRSQTKNDESNEDDENNDEIVEEVANKKSSVDWFTEELEESILNKIENITLVFVEEGTSKGKLYKLISKNGKVVAFEKKKPNELASWLVAYSLSKGCVMNKDVATYLIEICGSDKNAIANEFEKLAAYVDNKEITKASVDEICTRTSEIIIFDLTDNIGAKKKDEAIKNLDDLINNKEPVQKIFVMIMRHFWQLVITKECELQKKNVQTELGLSYSFIASKYINQAKNFTKDELVRIYKELVNLDIESKTISTDLKVGLQKIIMS